MEYEKLNWFLSPSNTIEGWFYPGDMICSQSWMKYKQSTWAYQAASAKWCRSWNALSKLVLQLPAVVGEGELLERRFGVQEPLYGVVQRLGGSLILSCPASLGSRAASLLQSLMRSHSFLAARRVHLPAPLP